MNNHPILLVEDNPDDLLLTLRALKKGGIPNEVVIVRDGVEALDFLFPDRSHPGAEPGPLPALVLLDLKMPRIDGLEVLRAIKGDPRTSGLPVIILTSSNHEKDISDALNLGADLFLQKPIDPEGLKKVVAQWGL
jgi:two-component system response regulator